MALALLLTVTLPISAFAYWPAKGTNPYPNAGADTMFVENGIIYVAYTVESNDSNRYQLVVMKKEGSSQWTPIGGGVSYTADEYYYKFGEVEHPSIYVYNGVPYVAYIDHSNYTYNPTVIKYNSSTNSWDIVGSRQITPDPQGFYSVDNNHQIVADSNGGKLFYSADYVTMYVSPSGTPYIAINESILDDDHPLLSTNKVVVMNYNGGWNTIGFAGFGDYICKGTPAIIHADGETYVAYYETDSSTSSYKDYLVVEHPVGVQTTPTSEATAWAKNFKFEVNWSDKVQLKYDDGFLYLCFVNTNSELEVVKCDTFKGGWSSLGEIPFDTFETSKDDYSMTVFEGTPYVAYMGYFDNTAHVAMYNGTEWEIIEYNDDTALPANVNDINLSNDNNALYLTGTDMYGNLYAHYYNCPINLTISQNAGGYYNIAIGDESGNIIVPNLNLPLSVPDGYVVDLKFYASTGYVIKSVLIDGDEIISSPCQTAATTISLDNSHNIVITYAPASNDAPAPAITTEPSDKTVNVGGTADLTVAASGTGVLSYQWYSKGTESITGALAITDATGSSYSAPTDIAGTTYYYCVVTNTDNSAAGNKTATANSRIAAVTVNELTNAAAPAITTEPSDKTVTAGGTADLTVVASGTGDLSYQWYSNGTNSTEGGSVIEGATGSSYSAPTGTAGTTYYYCVVTNTDNSAAGNKTATANSRIAAVTVNELTNAEAPAITAEPADITVNTGEAANLTLAATGSGDLSYQWYSNGANSPEGGSAIEGATGSSYSAPTGTAGTTYYFCVVTNTDNSAAGNKTATANSRIASVNVLDLGSSPIDQIISAVLDAINDGGLTGNGNPDKLADFTARLADAKLKIETGDKTAAIKVLESIYKQIDGKPSPRDLVVGDAADDIAQMIQNLIDDLKS